MNRRAASIFEKINNDLGYASNCPADSCSYWRNPLFRRYTEI
ncbi:MAG: hypothetical protein N2484_07640 [Clostridia bacterium]|nr:hypothetical protein [Clostridia bacterium]